MQLIWQHGAMFVRELVALYPDPKPHFNTISTMVRSLEAKGYLAHTAYGNSETEHGGTTIKGAVSRYFENSYLTAVSALVKEEKISVEELKQLIEQIEKGNN